MHMLSWLAVNGTAAIVEFPGVLYRSGAEQKIRRYLVDFRQIAALYARGASIPEIRAATARSATVIGEYMGKCAELCGEYHSLMLFKVRVVSEADYQAYIQSLADKGQTGALGPEYNTNTNLPGTEAPTGNE